jgi:hypothetical protein
MSIRVMSSVWENTKQSGSNLVILLAISDFANDDGEAWPSVNTLAKKARITERECQFILRKLTEAGEIEIDTNGGPHRCNLYRVKWASPYVQDIGCSGLHPQGEVDFTQTVKPASPEPSITIIEPLVETRKSKKQKTPPKPKKETDARVIPLVKSFGEQCLGYPVPDFGKEAEAAAWMLKHGYTAAEMFQCYRDMKKEPFWEEKKLSLQSVKGRIGEWKRVNGNGNGSGPSLGNRVPIDPDTGQEMLTHAQR